MITQNTEYFTSDFNNYALYCYMHANYRKTADNYKKLISECDILRTTVVRFHLIA